MQFSTENNEDVPDDPSQTVHKYKIPFNHIYKRLKDYGFENKTLACNIVLHKKIGQGGEGAAYKIKLKANSTKEKIGFASKEFNYTKHENDP